jgi:glycosyltransferase involved in cell wall biosynthesis
MPGVYDRGDIFVNSSVVDNQPVSILEAFAAGLPVVSTTVGGIGALVRDGETGLAVPTGDPEAMANAVMTLLADDALACRLVRRARCEAARHEWSCVRDQWDEVYGSAA